MDTNNSTKPIVNNDLRQATPQLESLDELTSKEIILTENNQDVPESIANRNCHRITCEAVECYSKADTEVHLKVGTKGIIPLFLCAKCRSKFQNEIADREAFQQKNHACGEDDNT